jgi:hypothetical protein
LRITGRAALLDYHFYVAHPSGGADGEGDVEGDAVVDLDADAFADPVFEAGGFDFDAVGAGDEEGDEEVAGGVSGDGGGDVSGGVDGAHGGGDDDGAGGVVDTALDLTTGVL